MYQRSLLISDIHLRLASAQSRKVLDLLRRETYDLLVIVGDLFNGNLDALTDDDWALLDYIRVYTHTALVVGNHDRYLTPMFGRWSEHKLYDQFLWDCAGLKCLAVHGHQFDSLNKRETWFNSFVIWAFTQALQRGWLNLKLERDWDEYNADWGRDTARVEAGVIELAKSFNRTVAFAGHTHVACESVQQGIHYLNLGCALSDIQDHYGIVDKDGAGLIAF